MSENKLNFKTNVLLKNVIGKELINDDNIAILELVKNSYDANSKVVNIIFKNLKDNDDSTKNTYTNNTSKIIIQDFGIGMDINDITDKWLNIAYSEKKYKKEESGRTFAGAKGVGRFSCDRLGEYLDLYTRKGKGDYIHVIIDWKNFEVENNKDLEIQHIEIPFEKINSNDFKNKTGYDPFDSGTVLEINKLRSKWAYLKKKKNIYQWNIDNILKLRSYLERLINPNQAFKKDSFIIDLVVNEFIKVDKDAPIHQKVNGKIKNKIFEKLDFTTTSIESEIDETGEHITTVLKNKNRVIFKLIEKNTNHKLLKNIRIVIYYLNPYAKIYFKRQTGIRSKDFGSIYLFINSFRISPYGDSGDDWLGLEIRKGQGYARYVGTRELVGRIEIIDQNNQFKIVSSREGVVKDNNYQQLTNEKTGYFYKTLKRLEKYVVDGLDWDKVPKRDKTLKDDEELDEDKYIRAFEKKVLTKGWKYNASEEIYKETQDIKNKRIILMISSIINTNPEDVIELYIDSNLISNLIDEEKEKVEKIFKEFNKYDSSIINRKTSNALKKISNIVEKKEKELIVSEKERTKLVKEVKEKEEKLQFLTEENIRKTKQIYFQQKLLPQDLNQLINLHHIIGIQADTINNYLINLKEDINNKIKISKEYLFNLIENISFECNKITSVTNFATVANFSDDSEDKYTDLIEYFNQYISNVSKMNEKSLKINFTNNCTKEYKLKFKRIEIAIIIDNLISNSKKAHANIIDIIINCESSNILEIVFKDDGKGIKKEYQNKIFDFGFTTTDGSGLGLNHIKTIIEDVNGEISLNIDNKKGAEFIIKIKK